MNFDPKQAGAAMNENMASSMQGFAAASNAMQAVTNEMMSMSMASLQKTTEAFQQMQGARSLTDIMRIQADFFRTSFEDFATRSRRIAELATQAPASLAKQATEVAIKTGHQTEQAAKAVTQEVTNDAKAATVGLDG